MQITLKRQCWECLRRRLVCDFARPSCNKCRASGVECPGYDEKKPLKWLAPGKVSSRRRRRQDCASQKKATGMDAEEPITLSSEEEMIGTIPRIELSTEICAVVEAVYYYNTWLYPSLRSVQLAPNPYTAPFPMESIHLLAPSLRNLLVCFTVGYRLNQLPRESANCMPVVRSRLYEHRGVAIRALSEEIAGEKSRGRAATLASVMFFLCVEFRLSNANNWQQHLQGAMQLIMLHGGFKQYLRSVPRMKYALYYLFSLAVIGNTTSPPSSQVTWASDPDLGSLMYEEDLPLHLCPKSLFLEVISINRLRSQAYSPFSYINQFPQSDAADEIRTSILGFSPESWASTHSSSYAERLLLGRIYQCAILIYFMSTIQPHTSSSRTIRTFQRRHLFSLLREAIPWPQLRISMTWPLIVAGVEAVHGDLADKKFVIESLKGIGKEQGSALPGLVNKVLEKFWRSGKTGWDECFEVPYAFVA